MEDENDNNLLNNSYTDDDYIMKNALTVFHLLKKNNVEMKDIQQEIVALLLRYGVDVNEENLANESLSDLVCFY